MKQFTTNKILVELTTEELEILNTSLNSATLRMDELGWERNYIQKVEKLWYDIYKIQKSLPF